MSCGDPLRIFLDSLESRGITERDVSLWLVKTRQDVPLRNGRVLFLGSKVAAVPLKGESFHHVHGLQNCLILRKYGNKTVSAQSKSSRQSNIAGVFQYIASSSALKWLARDMIIADQDKMQV
jgi:hypothetical protein